MQGIEGYHLVRRIGAGGMGTVHEALDADGRRVAVKVLHEAIAADPAARRRLRREVELLHRVRGPGVARVLDAEVDGETAFVVTELVEGPTLEDDIRTEGHMGPEELADLAHGLADGLRAIHAAGITHRDLKPGNVMLSSRGPVIIDFGIAQVADDVRLTQTGMITGTPGYLDPDVIAGADPGPDGDWWAWAAVLTFAGTGHPPFGRGTIPAVLARVSTGAVDTTGLPEDLAQVLRAALHPEPGRRLAPDDVLAALDGDWDRPALQRLLAAPSPPQAADRTAVLPPPAPSGRPEQAAPAPQEYPPAGSTRVMPADPPQAWATAVYEGAGSASQPGAPGPYGTPGAGQPWGPSPYEVPGAVPGFGHPGGEWFEPPAETPAWARPPRRRTGTVAALGLGLSAGAVLLPGWWALAVVVVLVVLGAVGRGARRLRAGQARRGLRRSDVARAWLGAPVHLLWAAGAALPGVLVGGAVAAGGWWLVDTLVSPSDELAPWLLWAAGALGLGIAWTVLPSAAAREGARVTIGVLPRPLPAVLAVLGLVAAGVVALTVLGGAPDPLWDPFPAPS